MQRKSDAEKKIAGTWRKDRAQTAARVTFASKVVKPPRGANADVRAFYRRHAQALVDKGLLTEADESAFQLMAESYAIAREAWRVVQKEGFFRRDENDVQRRHPGIQVHRDALATFTRLAAHFGLTPKARGELKHDGAPDPGHSLASELFAIAAGGAAGHG
jgi:P27 family predicted phage terminase small subunit